MSSERRYDEVEIAQIFEAAAAPVPATPGAAAHGLTLHELQEIGREVGIAPSRIAGAAAELEGGGALQPRRQTTLGMPVGVGRMAALPRRMTDREWSLLLAELRDTFGAVGGDRSTGEVRQWSNGNLHVVVEPSVEGWRLRLGTVKREALAVNSMGAAGVIIGLATSASLMFSGEPLTSGLFLMVGLGGGAFLFNALRLPRWARQRESQMQHIIGRTHLIMGREGGEEGDPEPDPGRA
jgi:hypothetical protein